MACRLDLNILRLGCECFVLEDCRECSCSGFFTCSIRILIRRFDCFCFCMFFVVLADPGSRNRAVIFRPLVFRFSPLVSELELDCGRLSVHRLCKCLQSGFARSQQVSGCRCVSQRIQNFGKCCLIIVCDVDAYLRVIDQLRRARSERKLTVRLEIDLYAFNCHSARCHIRCRSDRRKH